MATEALDTPSLPHGSEEWSLAILMMTSRFEIHADPLRRLGMNRERVILPTFPDEVQRRVASYQRAGDQKRMKEIRDFGADPVRFTDGTVIVSTASTTIQVTRVYP